MLECNIFYSKFEEIMEKTCDHLYFLEDKISVFWLDWLVEGYVSDTCIARTTCCLCLFILNAMIYRKI